MHMARLLHYEQGAALKDTKPPWPPPHSTPHPPTLTFTLTLTSLPPPNHPIPTLTCQAHRDAAAYAFLFHPHRQSKALSVQSPSGDWVDLPEAPANSITN